METIKTLIITSVICLSLPLNTPANEHQKNLPCSCPRGYSLIWAGAVMCVSPGIAINPCPQTAEYDESLNLCTSDPGEDGSCPDGMEKSLYKDVCLSQPDEALSDCIPGGEYDENMSLCTAPCR